MQNPGGGERRRKNVLPSTPKGIAHILLVTTKFVELRVFPRLAVGFKFCVSIEPVSA